MSSRLDPDQAGHFVRPDLGPNCVQRLSQCSTPVGKELNAHVDVEVSILD